MGNKIDFRVQVTCGSALALLNPVQFRVDLPYLNVCTGCAIDFKYTCK